MFLIQKEFAIASKKPFYVNVPNGNIPLQQKVQDQGLLEPWKNFNQCDLFTFIYSLFTFHINPRIWLKESHS